MNITDLLDENKTLQEKIEILDNSYKNKFSELDKLDIETVKKIEKSINSLIKENGKELNYKNNELKKLNQKLDDIINIEFSDLDPTTQITYQDKREKYEQDKKELENEIKNFKKLDNLDELINTLQDKKIKIEQQVLDDTKNANNTKIGNLQNDIDSLNKSNNLLDDSIVDYNSKIEEISKVLNTLWKNPEFDRDLFNEKLNEKTVIEEEVEEILSKIEKNEQLIAEKQREIESINKEQSKIEKQENKKKEANEYLNQLTDLCKKDSLSFAEKEKRESLYHLVANSKELDNKTKEAAFQDFCISVNKTGAELLAKVGKKKVITNPKKQIPVVSTVGSAIAKGSLLVIDKMSIAFDKFKQKFNEIKTNVETKVFEGLNEINDKKIEKINEKKEKYNDILEKLKQTKYVTNITELPDQSIEEVDDRSMGNGTFSM